MVAVDRSPAGATGEPVIRTEQLTKRYGELTAVDSLDLQVWAGEVYGLLGPNGAGKTTTILMLLGLSEPTSGQARVLGLDPSRKPLEVKRRVGYLPDNAGFYGEMSGRANLRYTARLNRLSSQVTEPRIQSLLDQVGLAEVADRRVDTYSRGMRQRLGIADALVKDPQVLILDEPTVGIDPQGVTEILALIRGLAEQRGIAVLLSSHLLSQVQSVCDRVGIFSLGRLVAQGTVADLGRVAGGTLAVEVGAVGAAGRPAALSEIASAIRELPGIAAVTSDPSRPDIALLEATVDPRPRLAEALAGAGLRLVHLRRREEDLGAIYARLAGGMAGRPAGSDADGGSASKTSSASRSGGEA
jgi:ABC-2 type transport system ATP-binding protein